ncbi:MAG: glucose-1-phosphate adenylyltransferase subunit GlgD [Hydrogenoanaerobacterium sp.]
MKESKVLGIVFSNMHDEYMGEITTRRTMASVPFGGRYRLIDFTLSNMVNSGIEDIGVITKSNYQSLMDHLGSGRDWDLARKRGGLCILPPFSSVNSTGIYKGRLDALAGILGYIRHSKAEYVVMADCDVISNIDLADVVAQHIKTDADLTLVYKRELCRTDAMTDTTILKFDEKGRVNDVLSGTPVDGESCCYLDMAVIEKQKLEHIITESVARNQKNFKDDVLIAQHHNLKMIGYEFTGYATKINSMKSYYDANMDLLDYKLIEHLFTDSRPIYTKVRDEAPAKYGLSASVGNSLVADGCVIDGEVENSILFRGVKVAKGAKIKNAIIMQGCEIGEDVKIECVIVDKDVTVRSGRNLMGHSTYPVYITKGATV